jgi:hypothetical protein
MGLQRDDQRQPDDRAVNHARYLARPKVGRDKASDRAVCGRARDTVGAVGDFHGDRSLPTPGASFQDKVGARSTGKGAAIGGALFLLGPAIVGVGVLGGTVLGRSTTRTWG